MVIQRILQAFGGVSVAGTEASLRVAPALAIADLSTFRNRTAYLGTIGSVKSWVASTATSVGVACTFAVALEPSIVPVVVGDSAAFESTVGAVVLRN